MADSGHSNKLEIKTYPIGQDYSVHWGVKLGSGISGPVRLCIKNTTGERFALKSLVDRAKSRAEVELHYRSSGHPNIVSVTDVYANEVCMPGERAAKAYLLMVMELMEGGELFDRIRHKISFTEKEASEITRQNASIVEQFQVDHQTCTFFEFENHENASIVEQFQVDHQTCTFFEFENHEVASAVCHIHSLSIAHRDLKPENLLLKDKNAEPIFGYTQSKAFQEVPFKVQELLECDWLRRLFGIRFISPGNVIVKLADFGFAKEDKGDLMTPQFTPYYVSPQVLEAQRFHRAQKLGRIPAGSQPYTYDKSCDMWSLGVIIYIMLCGYPPFYSENPHKQLSQGMRRRIMAGEYDFPAPEWSRVSQDAKDVVKRLLSVNPTERLTIQELMSHSWIKSGKAPETPLRSPHHMMDEEAFEEAMNAHSAMLTDMRLPEKSFALNQSAMSKNPIIQKRKQQDTCTEDNEMQLEATPPTSDTEQQNTPEQMAIRSLRDIIAYCYLPASKNTAGTLFEEGLLNLVAEALRLNPEFTYLLKALKIESWNGSGFQRPVNRLRLANNLSEILLHKERVQR